MSTIESTKPLTLTNAVEDVARVSTYFTAEAHAAGYLTAGESLLVGIGEYLETTATIFRQINPNLFPLIFKCHCCEDPKHINADEESLIQLRESIFNSISELRSGEFDGMRLLV